MSTQNSQQPQVGHQVQYTDQHGKQHQATIRNLNGSSADIEAHVDGASKQFASVPHSSTGGPHTWKHTGQNSGSSFSPSGSSSSAPTPQD